MQELVRIALVNLMRSVAADHVIADDGIDCSCGGWTDGPFAQHLLDALAAAVEPPATSPHRVKVPAGATRRYTVTVETPADDSDPRTRGTKVSGAIYSGPTDCPDCGRGLTSREGDLICPRLPSDTAVKGSGGIVACGVTDG